MSVKTSHTCDLLPRLLQGVCVGRPRPRDGTCSLLQLAFEDHDMVIVVAAYSQAAFAIARKFSVSTYAACATATALATLAFAVPTIAPACAAT